MDAVYLVRGPSQSAGNEDLRYSLRSLAAFIAHDRVWIVGYCPPWVTNVRHLPSRSHKSKWTNLPADLLAVARQPELSELFAYWNDDFFALRAQEAIPLHHRGLLSAYIGRRGAACSEYVRGQRATLALLRNWGYPDPYSYETHMPLVMDKAILVGALERALAERHVGALAYRSLYGAVAGLEGTPIEDMKKTSLSSPIPPEWAWVSTSDSSFANGQVGRDIRAMFPAACQYERRVDR